MSFDIIKRLSYAEFLNELKERIRTAQTKAVLSVNKELISLYWDIGRRIVESQEKSVWGKGVVEKLAGDLRQEFPDVKGFSARNLWDMRRFYLAYKDHPNLRQAVAEIPWGHNLTIINKVKDPSQRQWYSYQTTQNGWSRNVLVHQIESDLYGRQAAAIKTTNFPETLPSPQSELMEQTIKDPYIFDFITIGRMRRSGSLKRR